MFVSNKSDTHVRRPFKPIVTLDNFVVCWRDKLCSSRIYIPRGIIQHPRGPEGGNLEPVMHSWFAYDLPHMTRHAMPMATGNQRSMCGQRKYLAGKRRAARGRDCLVTLSLFLYSYHNNVDAQTYSPAASELLYTRLHSTLLNETGISSLMLPVTSIRRIIHSEVIGRAN